MGGSAVPFPSQRAPGVESYTSQPTLAPPPPVPAPAPAPLRSQFGGARRTDTECEGLPFIPPPHAPSPGSLLPSPFFKSCVTSCRSLNAPGLSPPPAARRTHVVAGCALARVTLTRLSPPTSRQLAY